MLGLTGVYFHQDTNFIYTCNNADQFNLKPWPVEVNVKASKMNPSGKRLIPAATEEDFRRILKEVPETSQFIGELSAQQEKLTREAWAKNHKTEAKAQSNSGENK